MKNGFAPSLLLISRVVGASYQDDHAAIRLQAGNLSLCRSRVAALLWPSDWLIAVDATAGDSGGGDTG